LLLLVKQVFSRLHNREQPLPQTAAAAAETEFTVAAQAGAVAQAEVAVATEATAVAAGQAAASVTLFGVGLLPLVAVGAAIAASGFALYKAYEDILSSAKNRLALEEAIAGAMNKQALAAAELKTRLAGEAENRSFSGYLENHSPRDVAYLRDDLQSQYDELEKRLYAERDQRARYAALPNAFIDTKDKDGKVITAAENARNYIDAGKTDADAKLEKDLQDKISNATTRLAELQKNASQSSTLDYHEVQKTQLANLAAAEKQQAEAQKKAQEEAQKAAEKYRAEVESAYKYVAENFATLSGSNNPFVKIFSEGQKAIEQMLVATKALAPELQRLFAAQINLRTQNATFQQDLGNRVKAFDLRNEARQFRAGALDADNPENFQKQSAGQVGRYRLYDRSGNKGLCIRRQSRHVGNIRQYQDSRWRQRRTAGHCRKSDHRGHTGHRP
jgi:hypothetical protein